MLAVLSLMWVTFTYNVEVGYVPTDSFVMYNAFQLPVDLHAVDQEFYLDFGGRVYINDFFFFGGDMKTFVYPLFPTWSFAMWPFEANYEIETGVNFKLGSDLKMEIGFRDWCFHPQFEYAVAYKDYVSNIHPTWEGAYQELYIKISGKVGGKE